ncbi:hypothetical protein PCE1_001652 [Barthelona sp. PCE]
MSNGVSVRAQLNFINEEDDDNAEEYGLAYLHNLHTRKETEQNATMLRVGLPAKTMNDIKKVSYSRFHPLSEEFKRPARNIGLVFPYFHQHPPFGRDLSTLSVETIPELDDSILFHLFYANPRDRIQIHTSKELFSRGWLYWPQQKQWVKQENSVWKLYNPATMDVKVRAPDKHINTDDLVDDSILEGFL